MLLSTVRNRDRSRMSSADLHGGRRPGQRRRSRLGAELRPSSLAPGQGSRSHALSPGRSLPAPSPPAMQTPRVLKLSLLRRLRAVDLPPQCRAQCVSLSLSLSLSLARFSWLSRARVASWQRAPGVRANAAAQRAMGVPHRGVLDRSSVWELASLV